MLYKLFLDDIFISNNDEAGLAFLYLRNQLSAAVKQIDPCDVNWNHTFIGYHAHIGPRESLNHIAQEAHWPPAISSLLQQPSPPLQILYLVHKRTGTERYALHGSISKNRQRSWIHSWLVKIIPKKFWTMRLTDHAIKKTRHAHWSPQSDYVLRYSSRTSQLNTIFG